MRWDEEGRRCLTYGAFGLGSGGAEFLEARYAQHVIAFWKQSKLAIRFDYLLLAHGTYQVFRLFNLQLQTTGLCVLLVLLRIVGRKTRFLAQATHHAMHELARISIAAISFNVEHAQLLFARRIGGNVRRGSSLRRLRLRWLLSLHRRT